MKKIFLSYFLLFGTSIFSAIPPFGNLVNNPASLNLITQPMNRSDVTTSSSAALADLRNQTASDLRLIANRLDEIVTQSTILAQKVNAFKTPTELESMFKVQDTKTTSLTTQLGDMKKGIDTLIAQTTKNTTRLDEMEKRLAATEEGTKKIADLEKKLTDLSAIADMLRKKVESLPAPSTSPPPSSR